MADAKRRVLDAISTPTAAPANPEIKGISDALVTKSVTKLESGGMLNQQLVKKAGGDDGTRTRDLMRDRHAF